MRAFEYIPRSEIAESYGNSVQYFEGLPYYLVFSLLKLIYFKSNFKFTVLLYRDTPGTW